MGNLYGIWTWVRMTAQTWLFAAFTITAAATWGIYGLVGAESDPRLADNAWLVIASELARILAAPTMPLWVAAWSWLPAGFTYALNTPDDPDPVTQGWNGTNKEPQVIQLREYCGPYWARVYWLLRNCLYGLEVMLRPARPDFATVRYSFADGYVQAVSASGTQVMRAVKWRLAGRWLILYFGPWLGAYLDSIEPIKPNPLPTRDAAADVGGVPCLKIKWKRDAPF